MEFRLVLYILGVVMLVAAFTAMADQSGRLVGVHEIPPFVTERVEIVPKADHPVLDAPAQAGGPATVDSKKPCAQLRSTALVAAGLYSLLEHERR